MDSPARDDLKHPSPAQWWRHRRRLAYWAMAALTAMAIAAACGKADPTAIPLLQTIAWVFGVVIGAYYGNNIAEAFAKRGPTR